MTIVLGALYFGSKSTEEWYFTDWVDWNSGFDRINRIRVIDLVETGWKRI